MKKAAILLLVFFLSSGLNEMKRAAILLLVFFLCVRSARADYRWVEAWNGTQMDLLDDGEQIGAMYISNGEYRALINGEWSGPCEPPYPRPERFLTGAEVDLKPYASVQKVEVPDYSHMPSITVVSRDAKLRERVAAEAKRIAPDHRVKEYPPDDPMITPFKLSEDRQFAASNIAIIVQPVEDETGHAPATTLYSAENLAGKLRDVEASYDPNLSGLSAWTRTQVALAVGLGVTVVFSLIFVGVFRWVH